MLSTQAYNGTTLRIIGNLEGAACYVEERLVIRREVQDRQGKGVVLSNLGQVAQQRGQLEAADLTDEMGIPGGDEARAVVRAGGCEM